MEGLRSRLMDPALFKVFAEEFAAEWNRLQAEAGATISRARNEKDRVCRQIDRLVDALAEGEPAARLTEKLKELEHRRLDLERELETTAAPAPRCIPISRKPIGGRSRSCMARSRPTTPVRRANSFAAWSRRSCCLPENGRLGSRCAANWQRFYGFRGSQTQKAPAGGPGLLVEQVSWLRGQDLNLRPSGYEPDELPGCSTPRQRFSRMGSAEQRMLSGRVAGSAACCPFAVRDFAHSRA